MVMSTDPEAPRIARRRRYANRTSQRRRSNCRPPVNFVPRFPPLLQIGFRNSISLFDRRGRYTRLSAVFSRTGLLLHGRNDGPFPSLPGHSLPKLGTWAIQSTSLNPRKNAVLPPPLRRWVGGETARAKATRGQNLRRQAQACQYAIEIPRRLAFAMTAQSAFVSVFSRVS